MNESPIEARAGQTPIPEEHNLPTRRVKAPPISPLAASCGAERNKLAREVHDRIGQPLTAVKLLLDRLAKSPEKGGPLLDDVRALVRETQVEVRNFCLNLQSSSDKSESQSVAQLHINFQHAALAESIAIPVEVAQALIHSLSEALENVSLHAGVNETIVQVRNTGRKISVQVADCGTGFDPHDIKPTSFGLASMREVAHSLSGKLTIESTPGVGTTVTVLLPLSKRSRRI